MKNDSYERACTTCNTFATEIVKITRNVQKVNKSGLKRPAELRKLPKAEMPRDHYCR
jgi:hypothetical protein